MVADKQPRKIIKEIGKEEREEKVTCDGLAGVSPSPSDLCPLPRSRSTGERLRGERISSSM